MRHISDPPPVDHFDKNEEGWYVWKWVGYTKALKQSLWRKERGDTFDVNKALLKIQEGQKKIDEYKKKLVDEQLEMTRKDKYYQAK